MNNKLNFPLIFFIIIILGACTVNKESKKTKAEAFSLEKYLLNAGYVKLELKKMPSGHLHLSGILNGVTGNFILDTGAGATVIEEKNKEKFKMKAKESDASATGAGGTNIRIQESDNNHFKFEKLEFFDLSLALMDLDHVNNAFASLGLEIIDGVIGADILTKYNAIIDYTDMSLYLKK